MITCLCLTRNRPQWLPQAIRCYQAQTYPNRELLIVASGEDVRRLIPSDESIRYLHLAGKPEIGAARNIGCQHARGAIIAHWDDDDYCAPARLRDQADRLRASGKQVTGYKSMRFTDGRKWWLYDGKADYALGTSLMYHRAWWQANPFEPMQVGEDNEFVFRARVRGQLVTADANDLLYATIHHDNTSPRQLRGKAWREIAA